MSRRKGPGPRGGGGRRGFLFHLEDGLFTEDVTSSVIALECFLEA